MCKETSKSKTNKRIAHKKDDGFLRRDFCDLGGYDQVGRVLRKLVAEGELIKIGRGLYTRAVAFPLDGRPVPVKGVSRLMKEALGRVGVEALPSIEVAKCRIYNCGEGR